VPGIDILRCYPFLILIKQKKVNGMKKIVILDESDFKGEPGDLSSLGFPLNGSDFPVDEIFMIQPYNTIQCLKATSSYPGQYSVADFVKYVLDR